MTETINYVREDQIQDERTVGMFDAVNQNCKQKAENDDRMRREEQARIRELEAEKAAKRQRIASFAWWAWAYVVAIATLILMAHTGVIAKWVMELFTVVFSIGIGKIAGESGLFTQEG